MPKEINFNDEASSAQTKTERALWEALQRIETGAPNNPDLIDALKSGRLRVNFATVAKEAGCSRTLIGVEGCAYPKVRDAIIQRKSQPLKAEIERLRARVAELEMKLRERDSTYAELLLRTRALQRGRTPLGSSASPSAKERRDAMTLVTVPKSKSQSDR